MSFKGNYFVPYNQLKCNNTSNELVPAIKLWRQPDYKDIPNIDKMIYPATKKVFGNFTLKELIELSTVSIVMENILKEVIAYISLKTYPNIYSLDPAVWMDWMQFHYGLNEIKYDNTYFIHLLVWDVRYNYEFLTHILRTIFFDNSKLDYICLLSLPGIPTNVYMSDQLFQQYFTRIRPLTCDSSVQAQVLFVCSRSEQLPKLKIRHAVVEDNDELVEILDNTSKKIRNIYGDYYIADIILYPQDERSIIVAESEECAVGLLCLNGELNMTQLNQHFELGPFHGLRKHLPYEKNILGPLEIEFSQGSLKNDSKRFGKSKNIGLTTAVEEKFSDDESLLLLNDAQNINTSVESLLYAPFLLALGETSSSDTLSDMVSNDSVTTNCLIATSKHPDSTITLKAFKEYQGEIDVFAVEFYGLHQTLDDRMVYDLLIVAFEIFNERNYCLITLPTIFKTFPLLQNFVKLAPRPITTINHDLFVLHRNSIMSNISVRLIENGDIEKLQKFFNKAQQEINITDKIKETLDGNQHTSYQSYLMLSNSDIFGVIVLKEYCNYIYLKTNYDLDYHINLPNHKHCEIQIFYISPIFNTNLFFIFNEIHRLTGYTSFYYFLYDDLINQKDIVTIISDLIPIRPRRRIIYKNKNILLDNIKPEKYEHETDYKKIFSLYHTNIREFIHLRKLMVNTRIIIVGMSTTSFSFIEELIFNKFSKAFYISNIILVTPNKYSNALMEHSNDLLQQLISPYYHKFNRIYLKKINLKSWINIINGFLTKINRYKKYIVINNKYNIKYDYLFMLCGLEFYIPACIKLNENSFIPTNVFILNTITDAEIMYHKVKDALKIKSHYNIIIYGESMESYCCIQFLLFIGIKPQNIVFVRPPLSKKTEFYVPVFNDLFVEKKMHDILFELNIKVLNNHELIDWELNDTGNAKKFNFETQDHKKSIECLYCFLYDKKMVNSKIIKAVNRAGLVFDGRLVIDNDYQTNDPFVYAAGPLTKYRRILYAQDYRHEYYNSEEIGKKLAHLIIDKIDPTNSSTYKKTSSKHFPLSVPYFEKPIVCHCRLPNNYNYLYIRASGLPVPYSAAKILDDYGVDLYTGLPTLTVDEVQNVLNPKDFVEEKSHLKKKYKYENKDFDKIGYFRLHLNAYHFVHTIVCLTKNPIDVTNIIELWGQHEKLLNNLLSRYKMNLIYDFYEFFRDDWATAIYHDRFSMLTKLNQKLIFNEYDDYDQTKLLNIIKNDIIKNNWQKLNIYQRQQFLVNYLFSKYQKLVEKNLLLFLKEYEDELPMYAHPENVQNLLN